MAAFLVKTCRTQGSVARKLSDFFVIERYGSQKKNVYSKICIECHCYHTTPVQFKKRKTREEKKLVPDSFPRPKISIKKPVVGVWKNMTVSELAMAIGRPINDVLEAISYADSSRYNEQTVIENRNVLFATVQKLGAKYKIVPKIEDSDDHKSEDTDAFKRPPPSPLDTIKRHPVVTVMGHVDHGKTTLLDTLRHTSVVDSEFGGITQHIGAFNVNMESGERITFLDTPGHAAFSAMRARGANVTDIVILVVAADDGVMEQTIQSIRMAREANVPIIVAINKIDKSGADIARTERMLAEQGIHVENLGGDVPSVNISALKGTNLKELIETVAAQAEVMDLRGDPKGLVEGTVLEVATEVGRGKLATALIQRGTLRKGSIIVSGTAWAKVRAMFDHAGTPLSEATLSEAVQIIGWRELPSAGDEILEVESERRAHIVIRYREAAKAKERESDISEIIQIKRKEHELEYQKSRKERMTQGRYRKRSSIRKKETEEDDGIPRFNVVIKADVLGSVEAILDVLDTYGDENRCRLDVVHYGIGAVTETDVELAEAFNATIYTFNTTVPRNVESEADKLRVPISSHKVIYKLIDDIKERICKKLPPGKVEEVIGKANVLQHFEITEKKKIVNVAGCRCTEGVLKKSGLFKLVRGNEVIYEGKLSTMKHLKEDVNTIKSGVECGLKFEDNDVTVKNGDTLICYTVHEVPPTVQWDPGF